MYSPKRFQKIVDHKSIDEATIVNQLIDAAALTPAQSKQISQQAKQYVTQVRNKRIKSSGFGALMAEYDLSTQEGIALMCLAEALLRIPDRHTADRLIQDKISGADWRSHLNDDAPVFVNAATWSLILVGNLLSQDDQSEKQLHQSLSNVFARSSKGTIRTVVRKAMQLLGKQFVMGETIEAALKRARQFEKRGYRYSYDMLGEAAKTEADAQQYQASYTQAIHAIGAAAQGRGVYASPGISIKLTALLPRYEVSQYERVVTELLARVLTLATLAKQYDIGLTIDAEEADRLELSLAVIEKLAKHPELKGWNGLGLAVQAYQKRAVFVLEWLADLAKATDRRFKVRLVKGAYWDSEIKHAQQEGLSGYPVFTRKAYTDVSYIACIKQLFAHAQYLYPQFATHNAYSLAVVLTLAGDYRDFEFQCLHGMGDTLYDQIVDTEHGVGIPCRIYAPVGAQSTLLAYLVRRLLENGANSSFVNRIVDRSVPIKALIENPMTVAKSHQGQPHTQIPLPRYIYGDRMNSQGIDLTDTKALDALMPEMQAAFDQQHIAVPMIANAQKLTGKELTVSNPADHRESVGHVVFAQTAQVEKAVQAAVAGFDTWDNTPVETRAQYLDRLADLYEANMPRLMAICIKEAGKTIPNAVAEIREAVDFCRYYAEQVRQHFSQPMEFVGPTGEKNQMILRGKGVFVCISPWNFPLAIFTGEITAALAAGNTVIAKPAQQTSLIAAAAVELMHQAGFPRDVVQLLPGGGRDIGDKLTHDDRIAGVIFTGSTATAQHIQNALTSRQAPIATFIAETGGQNCMIVDSSALPEQVVTDVIRSSFDSAGQRCSALRVLFVQEDIADKLVEMLKGAMDELVIGDPSLLHTDVGPVIDKAAQDGLMQHINALTQEGRLLHQLKLPSGCQHGTFVPPSLFALEDISRLTHEVFGPVLHVIRFKAKQLDNVIEQINSTGFGLTFGIHSRIEKTIAYVTRRIKAGNLYVNRDMVGAVVGVQPFGGRGFSGTGPKAGGPYYLPRLAVEQVISTNTTASGGNASLMTLEQD